MTIDLVVGLYEHYKGGIYFVLGTAINKDDNKEMVVYRELNFKELCVSPKEIFLSNVKVNGQEVPRFKYVDNSCEKDRMKKSK